MPGNQPPKHKKYGFTLIELLVVVSLTVILMLAVSTLFMSFMVGSAKTRMEQKIREEGDYAITQMAFMIRNAKTLPASQICLTASNPMNSLTIENLDSLQTTFAAIGPTPRVASSSGGTDYYLTSEENELSSLQFSCYHSSDNSAYYINVSFQLKNGSGSSADRETALQNFSTGITLREKTF